MEKKSLKKIADVERAIELARNERSAEKPYDINEAVKNQGGTPLDKQERNKQLGRNDYSSQKPYDINSVD